MEETEQHGDAGGQLQAQRSILSKKRPLRTPDWSVEFPALPPQAPAFLDGMLQHSNPLVRFLGLLIGYYGMGKWLEWSSTKPALVPLLLLLGASSEERELALHSWRLAASPSCSLVAVVQHARLYIAPLPGADATIVQRLRTTPMHVPLGELHCKEEDLSLRVAAWSRDELVIAVLASNREEVLIVDVLRGSVVCSFLARERGIEGGICQCFWTAAEKMKDGQVKRELLLVGFAGELCNVTMELKEVGDDDASVAEAKDVPQQILVLLDMRDISIMVKDASSSGNGVGGFLPCVTAAAYSAEGSLLALGGLGRSTPGGMAGGVVVLKISDGCRATAVLAHQTTSRPALKAQALFQIAQAPTSFVSEVEFSPASDELLVLDKFGCVILFSLDNPAIEATPVSVLAPADLQAKLFADVDGCKVEHASWWGLDGEHVLVQEAGGSVAILQKSDLASSLEEGTVSFTRNAQLSEAVQERLFALECTREEVQLPPLKREQVMPVPQVQAEEPATLLDQAFEMLEAGAASSEEEKKAKDEEKSEENDEVSVKLEDCIRMTYKLSEFRCVGAEQFISQLVQKRQLEQALAIAATHDIAADVVYQHQWRLMDGFTVESILACLEPITNRQWVLEACYDTPVESLPQRRLLLQYGLRETAPSEFYASKSVFRDVELCSSQEYLLSSSDVATAEETVGRPLSPSHDGLHAAARVRFLNAIDRLMLYEALLHHMPSQSYCDADYRRLRDCSLVEEARRLAGHEHFEALELLFAVAPDLHRHRLEVLDAIPVTIDPRFHSSLLPIFQHTEELSEEEPVPLIPSWRGGVYDFLEEKTIGWLREACSAEEWQQLCDEGQLLHLGADDGQLVAHAASDCRPRLSPSNDEVALWYEARAVRVDEESGLCGDAVRLLSLARKKKGFVNHPRVEEAHSRMKIYSTLVYDCQCTNLTYGEFQEMSGFQKLELLLSDTDAEDVVEQVHERCMELLRGDFSAPSDSLPEDLLLPRYLVDICSYDIAKCAAVIRASRPSSDNPKEMRLIRDPEILLSTALACIYGCELSTSNAWQAMNLIFQSLPERDQKNESARYQQLQDQVDELEVHLEANELLARYNLALPLSSFRNLQANQSTARQLVTKLCNHAMKAKPPLGVVEWKGVIEALLILRKKVFTFISEQYCYSYFLEALLQVGQVELASEFVAKTNKGQSIVMKTAKEYFNSSASLGDPALLQARRCLALLPEKAALAEVQLLDAVELVRRHFPSTQLLPVQVRLADKQELIEGILSDVPDAYRKSEQIVKLSGLLLGKLDSKGQLELQQSIAMKAIAKKDFAAAMEICKALVKKRHAPAWALCEHLAVVLAAQTDEGEAGAVQAAGTPVAAEDLLAVLSFALQHCPEERSEGILLLSLPVDSRLLAADNEDILGEEEEACGEEPSHDLLAKLPISSLHVGLFYKDLFPACEDGPRLENAAQARRAIVQEQVEGLCCDEAVCVPAERDWLLVRSYLATDAQLAVSRLSLMLSDSSQLTAVVAFLRAALGEASEAEAKAEPSTETEAETGVKAEPEPEAEPEPQADAEAPEGEAGEACGGGEGVEERPLTPSSAFVAELACYCLGSRLLQLLAVPFDPEALSPAELTDLAAEAAKGVEAADGPLLALRDAFCSFHGRLQLPHLHLWQGKVPVPRETPSAEQALSLTKQMVEVCKEEEGGGEELLREVCGLLEGWSEAEPLAQSWQEAMLAAVELQCFALLDGIFLGQQRLPGDEAAAVLAAMAESPAWPRRALYRAAVHCGDVALRQKYLQEMCTALQQEENVEEVCDPSLASALFCEAAIAVEDVVACMQRREFFLAARSHLATSTTWRYGIRSYRGTALAGSGVVAESLPFVVASLCRAELTSKAEALVSDALLLDRRMRQWTNCAALLRHFLTVHSTESEDGAAAVAPPAKGIRDVSMEVCRALCQEALSGLPPVDSR